MSSSDITIDWLRSVNPALEESPPGWTAEAEQRAWDDFQWVLRQVFGEEVRAEGAQEGTHLATARVPPAAMKDPANRCAFITLSRFRGFYTVSYPWDVKPECLEAFQQAMAAIGGMYVPFTLFADPERWSWKYDWGTTLKAPPLGWNVLLNEDVWVSLFDFT